MTDAASISAFKQAQVQTEVIFAVARKTIEQARNEGDAAVALLQTAVDLQRKAGPQPLAPGQTINLLA
ncbi:MAG: hypothetical protein ACIAXF_00890 [Phycisphaerales bacterium JB063]